MAQLPLLAFPEGDVLFAKSVTNQFVIQIFDFTLFFFGGGVALSKKQSNNDAKIFKRMQAPGSPAQEGR